MRILLLSILLLVVNIAEYLLNSCQCGMYILGDFFEPVFFFYLPFGILILLIIRSVVIKRKDSIMLLALSVAVNLLSFFIGYVFYMKFWIVG